MRKKVIALTVFITVLATSCSTDSSSELNYEKTKSNVLKDFNVKAYFDAVELSSKTLGEFTLKNQEKANKIIQDRRKALTDKEKVQLRSEYINFKGSQNKMYKDAYATAQYHFLAAYKKFVKDGKLSKEIFNKIITEENLHRYELKRKEIEQKYQAIKVNTN